MSSVDKAGTSGEPSTSFTVQSVSIPADALMTHGASPVALAKNVFGFVGARK
jgi:hypothetical protein